MAKTSKAKNNEMNDQFIFEWEEHGCLWNIFNSAYEEGSAAENLMREIFQRTLLMFRLHYCDDIFLLKDFFYIGDLCSFKCRMKQADILFECHIRHIAYKDDNRHAIYHLVYFLLIIENHVNIY